MDAFGKLQFILTRIREVNLEPRVRDGLPRHEVLRAFEDLKLEPDALLVQMYEHCNGVDYLNGFLFFLSVDDAVSCYRRFEALKRERPSFEWRPTWFPVFDFNADVQVCLDLKSGELIVVDVEGGNVGCIARHYQSYIDALFEVFDRRKYVFEGGCLQVDRDAWLEIADRYRVIGSEEFW